MTYLLSFLTMFFLVWYLTKSKAAGVVSGIFYSFSTYHIAHEIFPSLCNMQWLPLIFLSLFILAKVNAMSMVIITGLIWGVIAYSDAYYGFMAMLVAISFFLWHRSDFNRLCQFLLVCIIIVLPFAIWSYGDWGKRLTCYPVPVIANWYDYFNPNFGITENGNFDFGGKNLSMIKGMTYHFEAGKTIERQLFIFPFLWFLAGLGIKQSLKSASFFWWLLICAFILSVTEPLCPIFRVSARWGVVVLLSVCVLSGYGVKWIEDRL